MPRTCSADLAVPDITEDAAERKRVLNILAQRRYRKKKRERLQTLETQNREKIGSSSAPHSAADMPPSNAIHPVLELDFNSTSDILSDPNIAPDLFWSPQFLSLLSPSPLSGEPLSYLGTSQLEPDVQDTSKETQTLDTSPNLSAQLQLHQSSTFTFPDDHIIEIPSLTLLNAAVIVAQRLNIAPTLWELDAISPFYEGKANFTSPPSLGSSSSSGNTSPSSSHNQSKPDVPDICTLPMHLRPTPSQRLIPHHPALDLLPWPSVRDKLIQVFNLPVALRPKAAQDPIGLPRLVYDMEDVGGEGIKVQGKDPFDVDGWEIGQVVFQRWWWAFEGSIVEQSNWARRQRGENVLDLGSV